MSTASPPTPAASAPEVDKSLLIGWDADKVNEFGFSSIAVHEEQERRLIQYTGDSHLITFGPTGTGKGRSVILPNLLNYPGTTVVVDVKNGELAKISARRRAEFGPVFVLDPFEITDFPKAQLNPFDIFSWPGCQLESDAEMLAEIFSQGNKGVKDPFWDQHGGALLAAIIAYTATLPVAERTIAKVLEKLTSDDVVYNLAVMLDTVGKSLPKMIYREVAAFLQLPDVTRGGILATTMSYLKTFNGESVLRTFGQSTVDLADFINGKPLTIYVVLPVDRLHSHRAILKLILGVLLKAIVTRSCRPETRTLLLIDECGQLGNFPFLETFITLCRSFGCWAWTFWQDLAQVQTYYPTAWKTILNNCGVVQSFGFHNRDLAEQWAGYFDSPPDELRKLTSDKQVVLLPGQGEFRCEKLDYLGDGMFEGHYDENPLYHQGRPFHSFVEEEIKRAEQQPAESDGPPRKKRPPRPDGGDGGGGGGLQPR